MCSTTFKYARPEFVRPNTVRVVQKTKNTRMRVVVSSSSRCYYSYCFLRLLNFCYATVYSSKSKKAARGRTALSAAAGEVVVVVRWVAHLKVVSAAEGDSNLGRRRLPSRSRPSSSRPGRLACSRSRRLALPRRLVGARRRSLLARIQLS